MIAPPEILNLQDVAHNLTTVQWGHDGSRLKLDVEQRYGRFVRIRMNAAHYGVEHIIDASGAPSTRRTFARYASLSFFGTHIPSTESGTAVVICELEGIRQRPTQHLVQCRKDPVTDACSFYTVDPTLQLFLNSLAASDCAQVRPSALINAVADWIGCAKHSQCIDVQPMFRARVW